ncbi:MAG: NAD-dependent epimerase/dehydratase family protein [Myxococcales bacterium]|nr:NAD-dependent epimerase/dehydratase family protein [Myxococcales bacterium]
MARYLVTGAAGFIASCVAHELLEAGHQVLGVDNLNDAYDPKLKHHRLIDLQAHEGFSFELGDISDESFVSGLDSQGPFEAVINLAARAGVRQSVANPQVYLDTNTTGTRVLLDLCRRCEVGKFLLASTSSVYGAHNARPYREDADVSRPLSPYAASKLGAEALCHSYHHLHGIDVSVVRYFTVYGPAGRPDMSVFRFVQWIREGRPVLVFGDGSQSRDFTFVSDIARGTVAALAPQGFGVINLGGDAPHSITDLIELIEEQTGRIAAIENQPMHRADVTATWADISAARELLGWEPRIALAEGVAESVAWYEANRSWAKDVETH